MINKFKGEMISSWTLKGKAESWHDTQCKQGYAAQRNGETVEITFIQFVVFYFISSFRQVYLKL